MVRKSSVTDKPTIDAELVDDRPKDVKSPGTALVPVTDRQLATIRDPHVVLAEAKKVANALVEVIANQPAKKKVMMNGEQYITFDGWQLVGNFYGCVPKIADDQLVRIDMGDGQDPVIGYEATADLVHIATGNVISSAKAMCLNDEDKWSEKNKYVWMYVCRNGELSAEDPGYDNIVWEDTGVPKGDGTGKNKMRPKKQRELVGTIRVPLFQLRSMAQTRACAKVLRDVFSHIVILAGFNPTPAEEMTDLPDDSNGDDRQHAETPPPSKTTTAKKQATRKPPVAATPPPPPAAKPAPPPPPSVNPQTAAGGNPNPGPAATKKITQPQVRRFWTIARSNGWSDDQVHKMILKEAKVDHTADIAPGREHYDRIVDKILVEGPEKYFKGRA